MKKTKLIVAALSLLGLLSCGKLESELHGLDVRLKKLETETVADLSTQMNQINGTANDLKEARTEIEGKITSMKNDLAALQKDSEKIAELSEKIANLETAKGILDSRIATLEILVDELKSTISEDLASKEWVLKTCVTIDALEDLWKDIAEIKKITQNIDDIIDNAIAKSEERMMDWVSGKLTAYCTIEQEREDLAKLETRLAELEKHEGEIDTEIENLNGEIEDLKQEIEDAKKAISESESRITEAYKKAIEEAISKFKGEITDKIAKDLDNVSKDVEKLKTDLGALSEKVSGIETRLGTAEGKIKSLEDQVKAINESIADLSSLRDRIKAAEDALAKAGQDITDLKKADENLGKRIDELQKLVNGITEQLKDYAKTDWVSSTFFTAEAAGKLQSDLEDLQKALDDYKTDVTNEISAAISTYDDQIKAWVGTQLAGYVTSEKEAADIKKLQDQIDALEKAQKTDASDIAKLKADLQKTQEDIAKIGETYKGLIAEAINTYDGQIKKYIASEIKKVDDKVTALTGRVSALETSVGALESRVGALEAMIQSITYVPDYLDGIARFTYKDETSSDINPLVLNFEVEPAAMAETVAKSKKNVTVKYKSVINTKASGLQTLSADSYALSYSSADPGIVTLNIDGEDLAKIMSDANTKTISLAMSYNDSADKGVNKVSSGFVGAMFTKIQRTVSITGTTPVEIEIGKQADVAYTISPDSKEPKPGPKFDPVCSSSDSEVVTAEVRSKDKKIHLTSISEGKAFITLTYPETDKYESVTASFVVVVTAKPRNFSVKCDGQPVGELLQLQIGDNKTLNFSADPAYDWRNDELSCEISDPDVVSYSSSYGSWKLTALKAGETDVTFTLAAKGEYAEESVSFHLVVGKVTPEIELPETYSIKVGEDQYFSTNIKFSEKDKVTITPDSEEYVTCRLSGAPDDNDNCRIKLTGNKKTDSPVSVTVKIAGSSIYTDGQASCDVTVTKKTRTITVSDVTAKYGENKDVTITCTQKGSDNFTVKIADETIATIEFSSSHRTYLLTPVKPGKTTLTVSLPETAEYEASEKTVDVTVGKGDKPTFDIKPEGGDLKKNTTGTYTLSCYTVAGRDKVDLTDYFSFSSETTSGSECISKVSFDGNQMKVTASNATGNATIKVSANSEYYNSPDSKSITFKIKNK